MSERLKQILKVNETFYNALETGNLELMEEIWVKDSRAKCVHPGWPLLFGWESIKQSWKTIFDTGGPLKIQTSNISVEISGNLAWLTCLEHISLLATNKVHRVIAQATNIFELHGTRWFIVHHHASSLPTLTGSISEEELQ